MGQENTYICTVKSAVGLVVVLPKISCIFSTYLKHQQHQVTYCQCKHPQHLQDASKHLQHPQEASKHPDYIFTILSNLCFIMQYHHHHPIQMDVGNQENNFHHQLYEAAAAMATDAHWKSETAKDLCDRSSRCSCCHTGSLKWQRTCVTGIHAAAVARATNCPAGQEWRRTYKTSIHVATVAKVTDLSWKSGMVRGTCILESRSNCCHGH